MYAKGERGRDRESMYVERIDWCGKEGGGKKTESVC